MPRSSPPLLAMVWCLASASWPKSLQLRTTRQCLVGRKMVDPGPFHLEVLQCLGGPVLTCADSVRLPRGANTAPSLCARGSAWVRSRIASLGNILRRLDRGRATRSVQCNEVRGRADPDVDAEQARSREGCCTSHTHCSLHLEDCHWPRSSRPISMVHGMVRAFNWGSSRHDPGGRPG